VFTDLLQLPQKVFLISPDAAGLTVGFGATSTSQALLPLSDRRAVCRVTEVCVYTTVEQHSHSELRREHSTFLVIILTRIYAQIYSMKT
jgi:hypothetical protein